MSINLLESIPEEKRKRGRPRKITTRASFQMIFNPVKFLNPYTTYLLPGDVTLFELNGELHIGTGTIFRFKHINTYKYDKNTQMLRFIFDEMPSKYSLPWRYLVNRLRSFGNLDSKEFGTLVENYCTQIEYIQTNFQNLLEKDQISKDSQLEQVKLYLYRNTHNSNLPQDVPIAYIKRKYSELSAVISEIGINQEYIKLTEYDMDQIKAFALENTVPEVNSVKTTLQNFKKQLKGIFPDEKCVNYIITGSETVKKVTLRFEYLTEIIGKAIYQTLYLIYDPTICEIAPVDDQEPFTKFQSYKSEYIKGVNEFLDKIYPERKITCKIKEI